MTEKAVPGKGRISNIFNRIMAGARRRTMTLGNPLLDEGERDVRRNFMANLNPQGFRTPKKGPKLRTINEQNVTRGELKRKARADANAKVSEDRPAKYLNSCRAKRASRGTL